MIETSNIDTEIYLKALTLLWALPLSVWTLSIAKKNGWFEKLSFGPFSLIRWKDLLFGFGLFIFIELILAPSLGIRLLAEIGNSSAFGNIIEQNSQFFLNFFIISGGGVAVLLTYFTLNKNQREELTNQKQIPWYKNFMKGIIAWLLFFPPVLAFTELLSIAVLYLFEGAGSEQVAVQQVRKALANPSLFLLLTLQIVTIVPFSEEFLFRGLLQSWIKQFLGSRKWGIIFSSLLFSAAHYSPSQGVNNFELLPPLFVLGCFLGWIYEKERSIWASIGLHSFFNLISVLLIFNARTVI